MGEHPLFAQLAPSRAHRSPPGVALVLGPCLLEKISGLAACSSNVGRSVRTRRTRAVAAGDSTSNRRTRWRDRVAGGWRTHGTGCSRPRAGPSGRVAMPTPRAVPILIGTVNATRKRDEQPCNQQIDVFGHPDCGRWLRALGRSLARGSRDRTPVRWPGSPLPFGLDSARISRGSPNASRQAAGHPGGRGSP